MAEQVVRLPAANAADLLQSISFQEGLAEYTQYTQQGTAQLAARYRPEVASRIPRIETSALLRLQPFVLHKVHDKRWDPELVQREVGTALHSGKSYPGIQIAKTLATRWKFLANMEPRSGEEEDKLIIASRAGVLVLATYGACLEAELLGREDP